MLPFEMHPLAAAEVDDDAAWMDARTPGRGDGYRATVAATIEFVCRHPKVGVPVTRRARKRRVLGYDYAVIYLDQPHRIYVVAVPHAKRRPNYWIGRLDDLTDPA